MGKLYSFCGGRKMAVFYLLLSINTVALFINKFSSEFGNFCILLGSVYVLGNIGAKFSRGKNE